jgi:2-polyprenyl-6-methoxyphenol hydroxylase-like FAD-dependent oxidoreductase
MHSPSSDVIVVGAGPVGLMAAGELAGAGIRCTVLERRAAESNLTRAFAVHARTLELLDARGVAEELVRRGQPVGAVQVFGRVRLDLSRLPSRFPFLLVVPQYHTEEVLEERAAALGVRVLRGVEATGLRQGPEGVDVDVRGHDGSTDTLRASYVVGADGVRSAIRGALGLPFPGRSVLRSVMLADVRLAGPPPDLLTVSGNGEGLSFLAPFGDGWYRVIAWDRRRQPPEDAPVDLEEVRDVVRRTRGTDYGMHDVRWMSRFHSDERQVGRYRAGRVLLAGDAAHVHSPAGGLGMNAGIQDAANLGWKLAAAVRGWAPEGLLDSYHAERHPVGRSVLRASGTMLRLGILRPAPLRAARNAVGGVGLRLGPVAARMAEMISGIGVAYPSERGAHPLTGRRAPDVPTLTAGRLYEALRSHRFVLVAPARGWSDVARPWADRVDTVVAAAVDRPLMLVRPDGYVAWASERTDAERRPSSLMAALARWCGPPAAQPLTAEAAAPTSR